MQTNQPDPTNQTNQIDQASFPEDQANEMLARPVNIRTASPLIWIYSVFALVVLAEFLIFIRSQYVGQKFCECQAVSPSQARILNGVAVPTNDLRWVASIYAKQTDKSSNGSFKYSWQYSSFYQVL